jgi:hypothetical protein
VTTWEDLPPLRAAVPDGMRLCAPSERAARGRARIEDYCLRVLPADAEHFVVRTDSRKGHRRVMAHQCLDCRARYQQGVYAAKREEVIARATRWNKENVERRRERDALPHNRAKQHAYSKRYYAENAERIRRKTKEWYAVPENAERARKLAKERRDRAKEEQVRLEAQRREHIDADAEREARRDELENKRKRLAFQRQQVATAEEWDVRELYAPLPTAPVRPYVEAMVRRYGAGKDAGRALIAE